MLQPLFLLLLLPGPVCGTGGAGLVEGYVLLDVNAARVGAGREAVVADPRLCALAGWRAGVAAASGSPQGDVALLQTMTRRLYRGGYTPHRWIESTLIGDAAGLLRSWRRLRPDWWHDAEAGEFEHFGIAVERHEGQLALTAVLAFSKRSYEWRQAAPLAELERVRQEVLRATNAARAESRKRPVRLAALLNEAAQGHAEDMLARAYYDHQSPEGHTAARRVRAAGYARPGAVAENIAKGFFAPDEVVDRWLSSSGHRRNILHRSFEEMGVGVAYGENARGFEVLWVQVFAGR